MNSFITGLFITMFLLTGRWNIYRLSDVENLNIFIQPRIWIITLFFLYFLLIKLSSLKSYTPFIEFRRTRLATLIFFLYLLLSFLWTPQYESAIEKLIEIILLLMMFLPICYGWNVFLTTRSNYWLWSTIFALGLLFAFVGLQTLASQGWSSFQDNRFAVLGGGPNVFGRTMVLFVFSCLYLWRNSTSRMRVCWLTPVPIGIAFLILSGSRGALIAFFISGLAFLIGEGKQFTKKFLVITASLIALLLILNFSGFGEYISEIFLFRIIDLSVTDKYVSGRDILFKEAWDLGIDNIWFGAGLGGYTTITGEVYPHNIFLEVFCEQGTLGIILLLNVITSYLIGWYRLRNQLELCNFCAFVICLTSSQASGSLYDSRGVFVFLLMTFYAFSYKPEAQAKTHPVRK